MNKLEMILGSLLVAGTLNSGQTQPIITKTYTTNDNVAVEFTTPKDDKKYALQRATTLTPPQNWTNVTGYVTGNGGKYRLYDNSVLTNNFSSFFYRVGSKE